MRKVKGPILIGAVILGWLVPGSGHWLLGMRKKAMILFLLITAIFIQGLVLGEFRCISNDKHPVYFSLQILNGGVMLSYLLIEPEEPQKDWQPKIPRVYEVGVLYTVVSGVLNFLAILDLFGFVQGYPEKRKEG